LYDEIPSAKFENFFKLQFRFSFFSLHSFISICLLVHLFAVFVFVSFYHLGDDNGKVRDNYRTSIFVPDSESNFSTLHAIQHHFNVTEFSYTGIGKNKVYKWHAVDLSDESVKLEWPGDSHHFFFPSIFKEGYTFTKACHSYSPFMPELLMDLELLQSLSSTEVSMFTDYLMSPFFGRLLGNIDRDHLALYLMTVEIQKRNSLTPGVKFSIGVNKNMEYSLYIQLGTL